MDIVKFEENKNAIEVYLAKPSIRTTDTRQATISVGKALLVVCKVFAIDMPEDDTLKILAAEIVKDFGDLRIGDIARAFKMAAKGKLNGVDITPYGKEINLRMCIEVLTAYEKYRNKKIKDHREQEKRWQEMNAPRNVGQCPEEISKANDERLKAIDELTKKMSVK